MLRGAVGVGLWRWAVAGLTVSICLFTASVCTQCVLTCAVYMQLIAAVPAGLLTDKCRRDTVLRVAAGIGLVAGLTLAFCLFFTAPVWCFMIAMGLVGAYKGFNNPAIESIFADSVQRGKRYIAHCNEPCLICYR